MRQLIAILLVVSFSSFSAGQQAIKGTGNITATGNIVGGVSNTIITPADYYVSPSTGTPVAPCGNGSDSNNGTSVSTPFATFNKARQVVRTVAGSKPLTVAFCGGTYYLTNLTGSNAFTSADSGTSTNTITYENYPGHTVIISGGIQLNQSFTFSASSSGICSGVSNCYTTTLSSSYATSNYFERLWYNGGIRFRPRTGVTSTSTLYGNYGAYPATQPGSPSFAYTATDPGMSGAGSWTNLSDVEITDFEKWVGNRLRFTSINTTTHQVLTSCSTSGNGPNACPQHSTGGLSAWNPGNRYQVENVKQLFGTAGQWYLDRLCTGCGTNPVLYYAANPGENPNTDSPGIVVGQNNQIFNGTGLQWVIFTGLQFQNDNYVVPAGGYASTQLDPLLNYTASTSQGQPSAMVTCTSCSNVTFNLNIFTQTTLSALEFLGSSANDTITNNLFFDCGLTCIKIGSGPTPSDTDTSVPNHFLISNNAIVGAGRFYPSGDGIMLGDVHDNEVSFNDIGYVYHSGIELCKPVGGYCAGSNATTSHGAFNNNIHDNDIHNIMQGMTDDGGCMYAQTTNVCGTGTACSGTAKSATGNVLTHNSCHDVNDVRAQWVNNSSYSGDGYGGHCWYLDSSTGSWNMTNNLCYRNTGIGFNNSNGAQGTGQTTTFSNNILAFTMQAIGGVQSCPPTTLLQFNFTNNIGIMDTYPKTPAWGTPSYTIQKAGGWYQGPSSPNPIQTQNWANNTYFNFSGTGYCGSTTVGCNSPQFKSNAVGCSSNATYGSLALLQAFGSPNNEEQGSTVTTNPGFTNVTPCTTLNDPNFPYPNPGVCDDYSIPGKVPGNVILGGNFTVFSVVKATSSTAGNGFGRYSVAGQYAIPTVPATYLEATFPAADF